MLSEAKQPAGSRRLFASIAVCFGAATVLVGGCAGPDKASIEVRRQNQALRDEIETMKRQRQADAATIAALQRKGGQSAAGELSPERLDRLFTVAGLQLGKLTGGYDRDPATPGDDAIRVQVVPIDASGGAIKAAGQFTIEAFDLSGDGRLAGRWSFDLEQSKSAWHGNGLLYHYLFTLPLDAPVPPHLTLKVTFTDELTARQFTVQRPITLRPSESAS